MAIISYTDFSNKNDKRKCVVMKKRSLVLCLALALSFCLSSCGKEATVEEKIEQGKSAIDTLSKQADEKDAKRNKLIEKNRVDLDEAIVFTGSEAEVKIKAYSIIPWTSLGEDEEQLYLIFDYTNNADEDDYFHMQGDLVAYQDGITLTGALYLDDYATSAIRPGKTVERMEAFVLRDKKTDVELVMKDFRSDEEFESVIKIK